MLLPHEIRKKEFSLAMGGYARSEVKSYLEYIADNYEKLRRENDELSRRLDAAMEKLDQYHASELAAITANVNPEADGADSEKTAAAAAILSGAVSSLQIELNMISARLQEIEAIMSGDELAKPAETDEIAPVVVEEIEEIEEVEEISEEIPEIEDEIETLDEIEDEIEELAILDEAESELELLDEVEDEIEEIEEIEEIPKEISEIEELDSDETDDAVLVFDIPEIISAPAEEADAPAEEIFEFIELDEQPEESDETVPTEEILDEAAPTEETEPEQIAFAIPDEDAAADAPVDEEPLDAEPPKEADEQLDIDDFLVDFFDIDDAIDAASEGEDATEEFVEFITPDEPESEPTPAAVIEPENKIETAPKKAPIKRFRLAKKKAAPEIEENFEEIPEAEEADFVEAEPAAPETTEEEDLEAILRALKVQYDNVSAAASDDDDDFDMTSFDEFNYIFGDSSSKIDTVNTENDIDDVLYDE